MQEAKLLIGFDVLQDGQRLVIANREEGNLQEIPSKPGIFSTRAPSALLCRAQSNWNSGH